MDKQVLQEKLDKLEDGIKKTELLFQQLLGQRQILKELIDIEETNEKKEAGKTS